ncbi:MAG: molybdate ABC transporter substrate-binding protein [SAR202 cluster bacterium]|nr:molybdate ABC transporter substrate-binding protein [SAR202 cluster bacterium]
MDLNTTSRFYQRQFFLHQYHKALSDIHLFRNILLIICIALVVACDGVGDSDVPLIFVAASLSDVVVEAGDLYEAETGNRVDFSFGGSIMLANQIAELGAPADGFFLVGDRPVLILREAGMYSDDNLMSGLVNKLVAIAPSEQEALTSLQAIVEQAPRVALGDPNLAPVGIFTREAFESVDLWDNVSKDAIFAVDARAATAAVQSGNADYGIVYKTDAISSHAVSIVYEIEETYPAIEYVGGKIDDASQSEAAADFLTFIASSPKTRNLFVMAGFIFDSPGTNNP